MLAKYALQIVTLRLLCNANVRKKIALCARIRKRMNRSAFDIHRST